MAKNKNPKYVAAALVATSAAAIAYKIYTSLAKESQVDESVDVTLVPHPSSSKSIAVTLLHSVLSSDLPLNDILLSSENVTFILPPYLSVDDLLGKIHATNDENPQTYQLPQSLIQNYKLLQCSNIQGYFHLLKNLKPDLLYVCSDDLGIGDLVPPDLNRFVKEIITLEQNQSSVQTILSKVFIR